MVKRWVHQELAFERFLRKSDLLYLAIDEAKRPLKIDKNFDFLVFTPSKVYAIDVKGKQLPYKGGSGFLWETWIHPSDVTGLRQWEDTCRHYFGCEMQSLIAYVYWIREKEFLKDFDAKSLFGYGGKTYGAKAITISDFEEHKIIRGALPPEPHEWQLPRKQAKELLQNVSSFLCI